MADVTAAGVTAGAGVPAAITGVEATVETVACVSPLHAAVVGAADSGTGAGASVKGTGSAVGAAAVGAAAEGAAAEVANVGATWNGHETGSKHCAALC